MKKQKNYLQVLTDLYKAVLEDSIDDLNKYNNLIIDYTSNINREAFREYYDNPSNPIKNTNLVILSCKHNKVKLLKYFFGKGSTIVKNLSLVIGRTCISPDDKDETCHNAFYYAIQSSNIELLNMLINKWPDNYFAAHLEELDAILSRAYEELNLKSVPLSDEMEIFVENKLINLRFFSNTPRQDQNIKVDLNNIKERIDLLLQNIGFLQTNYSSNEEVDKKFLFAAKTIAQNIYTLKRQLKSTYDRLPWEEIEFCLISFVSSYTKQQEIIFFYRATLNKSKMLKYLVDFSKTLEGEMIVIENIGKLTEIPSLTRDQVVAKIIHRHPPFEELYKDYRQMRDIYSLEKINGYIQLALSAEAKEREGQLIIARVLQVIGEYLKNTLESPNLSNTTSELFLLSLPKNAREIIVDLRNSLSHTYSLSKRIELEENADVNFFINVQNDIKKVGDVVVNILYNNKIKTIRILLQIIIDNENLDETKEIAEMLSAIELDEVTLGNFKKMEHEKLEKLVTELSDSIDEKTHLEKELFKKIKDIIDCAEMSSKTMKTDYSTGFAMLKALSKLIALDDDNALKGIKYLANQTLNNFTPKIEACNMEVIAVLALMISRSVEVRISQKDFAKINFLVCEIFCIVEFETDNIKWIEELREKFNEKTPFILAQRKTHNVTQEKYNNQLDRKLTELKGILSKNALNGWAIEKLPYYKNDKKLQAIVEMLVLDIMTILGSSKRYLENNVLFLDDNTPLLTGKCLRNHLAHDNALVDVLLSDPSTSVILNAKKLTEETLVQDKKIGKLISDDPFKLKANYDRGMAVISNQEKMFAAAVEGNLESLKDCFTKGGDIHARSINSWSLLHFAAKGPSLKVVQFIIDQNLDVQITNKKGENSLHVAAGHGRQNIVEFFIKETGLDVDNKSNKAKTPLHFAAQYGHKKAVEVLLRYKANTTMQDRNGFSPLHYAVRNNHVDVAKILLEKDVNVDINEVSGGYTPLHLACEGGHLELVNFLLQNNADVNAKSDQNWTPLHASAYSGNQEIAKALILKGASVNTRVINNGYTPLHYAVEAGHGNVANVLLQHGANVNAVADKSYNNVCLHYAAKDGYPDIVKTLLKYGADANVPTHDYLTPLHFAVQGSHLEIVVDLLEHGVNIHAKDINYHTALHSAAVSGHKEIAAVLIQHGAEIDAKMKDDLTPLHLAAQNGNKDVAELLIQNNAEINAQEIQGGMPIHAAALHGSREIIDVFIKNKADVNAKTYDCTTPLHVAAKNGNGVAVVFLIKNNAEVNAATVYGVTPLQLAVLYGHKDTVNLLINNHAEVNVSDITGLTPLYAAVEAKYKDIVEILTANGADVNIRCKNVSPLLCAVRYNLEEIVEILIANGVDLDFDGSEALSLAVLAGSMDTVEMLLNKGACIHTKYSDNSTLLHLAATKGHKKLVKALIARGANVDDVTVENVTSLDLAAQSGYEEIVEILLKAGANINVKSNHDFTPLHTAAVSGHENVVKVLLANKADVNALDDDIKTPIELAVMCGHLKVVKLLLQYEKVDIDAKGYHDRTLLHTASCGNNLQLVKYLVEEGYDINARDTYGCKPIHIAVIQGYKDAVEFFVSKGLSINELCGPDNRTLLHLATSGNRLEVVEYLVEQGADVNPKDVDGSTPIHSAASRGYIDIVEILLKNGAVYNAEDNSNMTPLQITQERRVVDLLKLTENLFKAVKRNKCTEVESCIKAGALVNAKDADGATPLHYAAWKGFDEVAQLLLKHKANPNAVGNREWTPLHYAAKFSHLHVVKALLYNHAVYNPLSENNKTPSDLAEDSGITSLFKLVSESFRNIKNSNSQLINNLNIVKDIETVKLIMRACNRDNQNLIVAAMHRNFSKVEQLKQILQKHVSSQIDVALMICNTGNYQEALNIFQNAFEERKEILGPDNPGTLDIQVYVAKIIYKLGAFQDALNIYEEILEKRQKILGLNHADTLVTRSMIALVFHRLGRNEEAHNIYQEVYGKQKEMLGLNHKDTLDTRFHMAMVMHAQGKFEEAINNYTAVYEKRRKTLGDSDPVVVLAQNNIAMVLTDQGNYEKALKLYKEVYERKKTFLTVDHPDTLRTLQNIASVYFNQNKYCKALKAYREVLNFQQNALGQHHFDTLNTQCNIACILFAQRKFIGALKIYKEYLNPLIGVFGQKHPNVLNIGKCIEAIHMRFRLDGTDLSRILQHLQENINTAASNGDVHTVERLLEGGADTNDQDNEGRTPLHYAVSNGHLDVVNVLLKSEADVTQANNKGNTPLHIASLKGNKEIVVVLLQHVSHNKLNDFINAKTTVGGSTALHVAANNGSVDVVKSLLKRGAIYDIKNNKCKTPLDLSKEENISNLLALIEKLFENAVNGNVEIIDKLNVLASDEFGAVIHARNNQGNTSVQVAIANKHRDIASQLLKMLKERNQNL